MDNSLLFELEKRLSKDDFGVVMSIAMTPTSELYKEAQASWLKEDKERLSQLEKKLTEFNKLYRIHFDKPLYREINTIAIEDIKNEMEEINARLCGDQTSKRSVRYRLAGN
jgi:DNA-binding transcriptional MerR regulator